jgi:hypothetical protein
MTVTAEHTLHEDVVAALGALSEIVAKDEADAGQYKYKYAALSTIMSTIRPVLAAHRLAVSQLVSSADGDLLVGTQLVHSSGERYQSGLLVVRQPAQPQQLGSMISYLRRYQLVALLGLAIEDDDASSAAAAQRPPERKARPSAARSELSDTQRRKIMALFGELGMSGTDRRDDRLTLTAEIIGRDIETTNDVTRAEAAALIDELSNRADELAHDTEGYET